MTTPRNKPVGTLGRLGEREFLKSILRSSSRPSFSFIVPPGDDSVVLNNPGRSILSIDGLTEGTHFKSSWAKRCKAFGGFSLGRGLGWKLIGSSLSDLAAMGKTRHRWAMVYLGAPGSTPLSFLSDLQQGVREAAKKYKCSLAGGDTVRASEISLVSAVGGDSAGGQILRRSGARPGDLICVAGTVGDAGVGLKILEGKLKNLSSADRAFFVRRFFQHEPMFDASVQMADDPKVTSAMDLSDSVLETARLVAEASKVGMHIHVDRIPVSHPYLRTQKIGPSLLTGGEDYSLFFTLRASALSRLRRKIPFAVIGHVVPRAKKVTFSMKGRSIKAPTAFEHFR